MGLFEILAILISLTALFSYLNHRFVGLPTTIGVMLIALLFSLALVLLELAGVHLQEMAAQLLAKIDFNRALLHGMLSFLLFAGALHVNLEDLAARKWTIGLLATLGVVLATFLVGGSAWLIARACSLELPFLACLLFGSLISPTDPIAVLGILRRAGAPKPLETTITGESLFNDGVGVVVFLAVLQLALTTGGTGDQGVLSLLLMEIGGGALFGLALGGIFFLLLRSVDNYQVEILLTLALVCGGYALADALHISGPIAIVIAGLLMGNQGRLLAMSDSTRRHLDTFWELLDETLNAVLFLLIGFEILAISLKTDHTLAGVVAIPLVLGVRWVSVALPVTVMARFRPFSPGAIGIMTWGGLRGGISVALALSLPLDYAWREIILTATYVVVVFSILVQGTTIGALVRFHGRRGGRA